MKSLNLVLTVLFQSLRSLGRSRSDLLLENVALRQQINALIKTKALRSGLAFVPHPSAEGEGTFTRVALYARRCSKPDPKKR
jgi:hypothetical protein